MSENTQHHSAGMKMHCILVHMAQATYTSLFISAWPCTLIIHLSQQSWVLSKEIVHHYILSTPMQATYSVITFAIIGIVASETLPQTYWF